MSMTQGELGSATKLMTQAFKFVTRANTTIRWHHVCVTYDWSTRRVGLLHATPAAQAGPGVEDLEGFLPPQPEADLGLQPARASVKATDSLKLNHDVGSESNRAVSTESERSPSTSSSTVHPLTRGCWVLGQLLLET